MKENRWLRRFEAHNQTINTDQMAIWLLNCVQCNQLVTVRETAIQPTGKCTGCGFNTWQSVLLAVEN